MTFQFAWFASPLIDGHYPSVMREAADTRLPRFTLDEQRQLVGSTDFLAVNLCVHVMPYTYTCTSTPCSPTGTYAGTLRSTAALPTLAGGAVRLLKASLLRVGHTTWYARHRLPGYAAASAKVRAMITTRACTWLQNVAQLATNASGVSVGPSGASEWLRRQPRAMSGLLRWITRRYGRIPLYASLSRT